VSRRLLLVAAACSLWLAGCATVPAEGDGAPPADPPATAAAAAAIAASAPKDTELVQLPDAARAPGSAEAAPAAEAPIDPLRPDVRVDLDDRLAHQDLWARVRNGFGMPDLDNELVRKHEQWYAARPDYVQRMTDRGSRYLYHVMEEVEKRGMPSELALLPFIESAFNPQAMSVANASGMWQFVPATGRDYDLTQNIFRDDRRDVLASTRAALDHLQRLYKIFGDWQLVLAAYNWGEGNVQKAVARNQRAGLPTDYMSLRMPDETRNYVPKLQAVKNIVVKPDAFGLALPQLANHPYFLSVPITRDLDVDLAAKLAGLSAEEFKQLNPQLNKPVVLAAGTPQVLLPYDNANEFVRNIQQHKGPMASWTAWVATRTLRPVDAARQLGVSEQLLRDVNRIPPRMLVKAGSTLLVPRTEQRAADVPEQVAENATIALAPDVPPPRKLTLKAGRKGETVASVARRYKVSAQQVAQWNDIAANGRFKPGHAITVFVPANSRFAAAPAASAADQAEHAAAPAKGGRAGKQVAGARKATPHKHVATKKAPPPKAATRSAKMKVAKEG
jgi:membrane-bound lytic murein transglycosylase D